MALSILLVVAGVVAAVVSGRVQRDLSHTNDFIVLFPLEIVGVLSAGVIAARMRGRFGVGVYLLVLAAVIGTLLPAWLPEDDTILGGALLAGALAGVGANLVLGGKAWAVRALVSAAAFVLVTASGWVAPLAQLHLTILVVAALLAYALWTVRPAWRQLVWVVIGSLFTAAVFVLRGPDDWASASTSVKLYSFPVLLIALGLSLRAWDQPAPS